MQSRGGFPLYRLSFGSEGQLYLACPDLEPCCIRLHFCNSISVSPTPLGCIGEYCKDSILQLNEDIFMYRELQQQMQSKHRNGASISQSSGGTHFVLSKFCQGTQWSMPSGLISVVKQKAFFYLFFQLQCVSLSFQPCHNPK